MVHVYDVLVVGWAEDRDFVLLSFVVNKLNPICHVPYKPGLNSLYPLV